MNTKTTIVGLLLFVALGCESTRMPPQANPAKARAALEASLKAWNEGKSPAILREKQPPIYFNDEIWQAGAKLEKFHIESERENGRGWACYVRLTLTDEAGKPKEQTIYYLIDTDPAIVIVQQPG